MAAFEKQRAFGALASDAAVKVGVSLATIFRWKSDEREKSLRQRFANQRTLVGEALRVLHRGPGAHEENYLEALFTLIGWLRCSGKPELLDLSVATLLVAVAKMRFAADTLDQLPAGWIKVIERHIRLSNILDFCCIGSDDSLPEFPAFFNDRIDDQPYDDRDELARICWCLLALGRSPAHRAASLGKAIYLINHDHFKYKWHVSRRTKEKFWRANAAASPFVFVERFHSSLELNLDPLDDQFLLKVDDLVRDHDGIRDFCRKVRTVVEQLMRTMDARALQLIHFPAFPAEIAPFEIPLPQLTPSMIASLKGYRSADK